MRDIHDRLADLERRMAAVEARVGEPPPLTPQELDKARASEEDWPVESDHGALTKDKNRLKRAS